MRWSVRVAGGASQPRTWPASCEARGSRGVVGCGRSRQGARVAPATGAAAVARNGAQCPGLGHSGLGAGAPARCHRPLGAVGGAPGRAEPHGVGQRGVGPRSAGVAPGGLGPRPGG